MLIIDGYNLMHSIYREIEDFESVRTEFIQTLKNFSEKKKARMVVFFDSTRPSGAHKVDHEYLQVRYVKRPADDSIKSLLGEVKDVGSVRVVTDDNEILEVAERLKIQAISTKDFAADLHAQDDSGLDNETREKIHGITENEAKAWLQKFDLPEKMTFDEL